MSLILPAGIGFNTAAPQVNLSIITVVGTPTGASSPNTTSLSLAQPSGIAAGDWGLISCQNTTTLTTPSGWTSDPTSGRCFYRVYDGSEGTVTLSQASSGKFAASLVVFRGVDTSAPIQARSASRATFSGTSVPSYSVTATDNKTTAIGLVRMITGGSVPNQTQPAGWTMQRTDTGTGNTYSVSISTKDAGLTRGNSTSGTWTSSTAVSSSEALIWLLQSL